MTLAELTEALRQFVWGDLPLARLHERLRPLIVADVSDESETDPSPWLKGPEDERLFWRLVYHVESHADESSRFRDQLRRIVAALDRTGSAAVTHELWPLILDQPRFCIVARKYGSGSVSRTGFLSVIAESGYPRHIKRWLQQASLGGLEALCRRLDGGEYDVVAATFQAPPA